VASGTLPAGLTLNTAGLLEGVPQSLVTANFTATVTDALGMTSSRNYTFAVDPPISALTSIGFPSSLSPRQTVPVELALTSPHPSPLNGELILAFTSNAEVPSDDPMTQFSSGSRVLKFTIPANTTKAIFTPPSLLLTGTVTGTVSLAANFENGPLDLPVANATIVATAPQMTSVSAVRTAGGLDVRMTGYAPTRRVTSVEFTFELSVGQAQTVTLQRNVDADFATWYRNPASTVFGSSFSFVQSFAVQGDTSVITAVTVRLTNAQGSTLSASTPLQ
jgi:hypothetical protein